jgi:hypothetical protein
MALRLRSRRSRVITLTAAVTSLVAPILLMAEDAQALGTWYPLYRSYNKCGLVYQNANFSASFSATVGNDGIFSRGYVNNYETHWGNKAPCGTSSFYTYKPAAKVTVNNKFHASGWSLDGCSVSLPPQFGCTVTWGGIDAKSATTFPSPSKGYGTDRVANFYFEAGGVGDISSITVTAEYKAWDGANVAHPFTLTQKSGNIQ